MRVLDRRRGPNPPRMIVIDTRPSPTAREADIHLAPKPGTNVVVLNRLLNLIIESGGVDRAYMAGQLADHEQAVSLFTAEAKEGQDAELKAFAAKTLPALQGHLQLARNITTQQGERAQR
jgi:anaerobic selenocysteine-containing dehydrogenase